MSFKKDSILMKGLGVSSGIVIGKVHVFERGELEPVQYCHLDSRALDYEVERFNKALTESKEQILRIRNKLEEEGGKAKEHIQIIDANLLIFEDQMLIDDTIKVIREDKINAEWALKKVLTGLMELFDNMEDEYFKERSSDIEQSVNRILINLMGKKHENISEIEESSIIVAHDLGPSDTAQMVKGKVLAFLTDVGGRTSHTSIMARSLEIPAVVGLESVTHQVETGDTVVIDGSTGTVIINPSAKVTEVYEKKRVRYEQYSIDLHRYRDLPAETTDGKIVEIMGNIEIVDEMGSLIDHGAEGVGLYRSEFLYLNRRRLPTEEEHLEAYKKVAENMDGKPVIIRTLDIGGDKPLPSLDVDFESNPAMGLRAIRLCFDRVDIFKTQLRGILRASAFGNIKVMFPMISGVHELRRAKSILEETKEELKAEGVEYNPDMEVGIMIEVPSAALVADLLAKESDFFSIGTNDLIQYTIAIDRVNEHVAYLFEPSHPAILRVIKQVVKAASDAGISVGICGEMAGEPAYALVFLGLGIKHLSMSAGSVLKVKRLIRKVSYEDAKEICDTILTFDTAREIEEFLSSKLGGIIKEDF